MTASYPDPHSYLEISDKFDKYEPLLEKAGISYELNVRRESRVL